MGTSLIGGFLMVVTSCAQQVVSEHPRFVVGSCVDSKGISCCLADSSERLLTRAQAQQVVLEYPRFVVGSCVDSKSISFYLAEIVCQSQSSVGTIR